MRTRSIPRSTARRSAAGGICRWNGRAGLLKIRLVLNRYVVEIRPPLPVLPDWEPLRCRCNWRLRTTFLPGSLRRDRPRHPGGLLAEEGELSDLIDANALTPCPCFPPPDLPISPRRREVALRSARNDDFTCRQPFFPICPFPDSCETGRFPHCPARVGPDINKQGRVISEVSTGQEGDGERTAAARTESSWPHKHERRGAGFAASLHARRAARTL